MFKKSVSQSNSSQYAVGRFHGLDAARAIALLIGIFHHGIESIVSYAKSDWVTQDSQTSLVVDILFYVSHVFRMQAFFLMSGFFAHLLFHRQGATEFIVNRLKRLLLPFVLFWPILYAVIRSTWVWGIQYVRDLPYAEANKKLPAYMMMDHGFPLMHLWFLYFLILFCVGVVLVRPLLERLIDPDETIRRWVDKMLSHLMNLRWGSLWLGLVMIGPMLGMTDWFGVDTSESGLVPRLWPFVLYGLYFTLGWFLHRQADLLDGFRKFRITNVILSFFIIATVIVLSLLFSDPADPAAALIARLGINLVYTFASITSVFAFIGYMLKWFSNPNPGIRYLSDGAYWGYLIHLPIIALLQILVAPLDWHWSLKLILIFGPTCLLLWITYQYAVRKTWIGILLNGPQHRKGGR